MTEDEAIAWLASHGWGSGYKADQLRAFAEMVLVENTRQNLIAASTVDHIWARHIVDSAQLIPLAMNQNGDWVDIGSGSGFPGMIAAILRSGPTHLVEARKLRAAFLSDCAKKLRLTNAIVHHARIETVKLPRPASVISARAFSQLDKAISAAFHLIDEKTVWVMPKGRNAWQELDETKRYWHGVFHVEQSITNRDSAIITATALRHRRTHLNRAVA